VFVGSVRLGVWGVFLVVCVSVSGVLFSVGVCVCVCDLLNSLSEGAVGVCVCACVCDLLNSLPEGIHLSLPTFPLTNVPFPLPTLRRLG